MIEIKNLLSKQPVNRVVPQQIIKVADAIIACAGDGVSGHPKVYLNLKKNTSLDCPYCGIKYIRN